MMDTLQPPVSHNMYLSNKVLEYDEMRSFLGWLALPPVPTATYRT